MKLSLIFPAYNEAESITEVLEDFSRYCVSKDIDHEILVVDDGSSDATKKRVTDFTATHQHIRRIEHAVNQGYGAALRSGFSAASGDFIFFSDSDGQFTADDLEQTLPLLHAKAIVLGYRGHRSEGSFRRLNAWLWGRCIAHALGFYVRDLNCAWKVFPRTMLDGITLQSRGAFINAELLFYARKKKLAFREVPVHHFDRRAGSPTGARPRVIFRALRELITFLYHQGRTG